MLGGEGFAAHLCILLFPSDTLQAELMTGTSHMVSTETVQTHHWCISLYAPLLPSRNPYKITGGNIAEKLQGLLCSSLRLRVDPPSATCQVELTSSTSQQNLTEPSCVAHLKRHQLLASNLVTICQRVDSPAACTMPRTPENSY